MRKITRQSVKNFLDGVPFKKGNMEVCREGSVYYLKLHSNKIANMEVCREGSIYYLKLHGNKIAALTRDGEIWISSAGWFSRTTKERLNGLPDVTIIQKKGQWYLNGNLWNGRPICIDK